jgi:hypothetical protein
VECFRENADRFEPLLPIALDTAPEQLAHLRLHNGTIWRWNRPIVGFDDDGTVHLRVEHRPLPAGPSLHDMMANLAVALGLFASLAEQASPPESRLPFDRAAANFREAACLGLGARLQWFDGQLVSAQELMQELLPLARVGLDRLGAEPGMAHDWLDTVAQRVGCGRTGARWQLARLNLRQGDLAAMTRDYLQRQASGDPVHTWS